MKLGYTSMPIIIKKKKTVSHRFFIRLAFIYNNSFNKSFIKPLRLYY